MCGRATYAWVECSVHSKEGQVRELRIVETSAENQSETIVLVAKSGGSSKCDGSKRCSEEQSSNLRWAVVGMSGTPLLMDSSCSTESVITGERQRMRAPDESHGCRQSFNVTIQRLRSGTSRVRVH